jgi:restriction endonuclease Mrr
MALSTKIASASIASMCRQNAMPMATQLAQALFVIFSAAGCLRHRLYLQARETAAKLGTRIVLIDGHQLTSLMIRHGVGCRIEETLDIKKIDEEFFD